MILAKKIKHFFSSPIHFYRWFAKFFIGVMYRVRHNGFEENIPETGAAIIIANHVSYLDGLMIHKASPRPIRFVIDEEIYNVKGVNYWMRYNRAIPIAPNRGSVRKALDEVSNAMKNGDLVCIFPEGQLTYTGNMQRFRFGIEWMLARDAVPVIPIAIKGLWGSMLSRKKRPLKWIPRAFRPKIQLLCGTPVAPEDAKINHLQRVVMKLYNMMD